MNPDFEYMKEGMVTDLIMLLVDEHGMNMRDALNTVYSSDTYDKLCDERSGLYFQSPRYVLSYLLSEMREGKMS